MANRKNDMFSMPPVPEPSSEDNERRKIMRLVKIAATAVFAIIAFFMLKPFTIIGAGDVGVVSLFGNVSNEPLQSGFHFVNPLCSITTFSTRIERYDDDYDAASIDQQNVHVKMTINSSVNGGAAPNIMRTIGGDVHTKVVVPAANEVLKAEMAKHSASDILKNRAAVKQAVQDGMSHWLNKYGVTLNEIAIANIRFDPKYEQAIADKQVKEQLALQKTYELQQTQKEAEIAAAKAKGLADAAVNEARGSAEATKIRADAESQYNLLVSKSLTPELIQMQYLTRWNGVLPTFMAGGNSNLLLQMPLPEKKN